MTDYTNKSSSIAWDDVIKKEARGASDDSDFGEVQEIGQQYVLTQKGLVNKEKFYIPKYLVQGYDGHTLWFNASEDELDNFQMDAAPTSDQYDRYRTAEMPQDIETRIPVIEERLNVSKRVSTDEATIRKTPVTETKTVEVPVTHEEVSIERRPASGAGTADRPVDRETEIKVPVSSEEVEVTKEPYVKEEVSVKKVPVTETRTVSDTVRSERVDVTGTNTRESMRDADEE
ncbi:MAG TPA: YsnF/AvaK domain-containing protein [Nitrososphaera sp.]|nr:YsnF/AvaK domain-containing protein [Nitrososphaera sp.]